MNQAITLNEINKEAFGILYKELGLAKTLQFLNQFSSGKSDYSKLKDELFEGKTVQDIVDLIKENQ